MEESDSAEFRLATNYKQYKPPREEIPIMRREPEPAVETAHTDEEDSDGDIEDYL